MQELKRYALILASCVGLLGGGGPALAQPPRIAQVFLTAQGTEARLSDQGSIRFHAMPQPEESAVTVIVDPQHKYQRMEGIGGALTDAAAETFYKLPLEQQNEIIRAYYDPVTGIGYTLARTHINSCDFSSDSYAYDDVPGDTSLSHFSIRHDLKYRIPLIRRVLAVVPSLKLFATPWSPPAWMKTNHDMLHGGRVKPQYRSAWAHYYVRFIDAYRKQGIPVWGLTVQNEPLAAQTWESCLYSAEEERDFVKQFLGPALWGAHLQAVRLMIWDHNRGLSYQRASTVLADLDAARYVWGTAFHWYVGDEFSNLGQVHDAFPDKAILFSEGCDGPFAADQIDNWKTGEQYGRSMINDFNNWTCGWCDWNILVDERGGPNHVDNFCFAPIIGDTQTGHIHMMNSYYYIGHFSRFIRPGARRIASTLSTDDLLATAFVNPDGRVATVVMNPTDKARTAQVWVAGWGASTALPAHSIATVVWSSAR